MGIAALRETLQPQRSLWRRLIVVSAAVAAVLIGLLAMHALNLESHHNEVAVTQSSAAAGHHHASVGEPGVQAASDISEGCTGDCGQDHSMLGACILAVAFGILAFAGAALVSRWSRTRLTLPQLARQLVNSAAPAPPSLIVLSISRT